MSDTSDYRTSREARADQAVMVLDRLAEGVHFSEAEVQWAADLNDYHVTAGMRGYWL